MRNAVAFITILLLLALPTLLLNLAHSGSISFGLLALLGICASFQARDRSFLPMEKKLLLVFVLFYGVAVLSFLLNSLDRSGLKELELFTKILFALPFLYLLLRVSPRQDWLWHGIVGGAMAAGLFGIYEASVHGLPPAHRVHGSSHWIIYGDISLSLAFMSLASLGCYWRKAKGLITFPLLAFILGLTGSILSGTRGAWIAFPVLSILLLWQYWKNLSLRLRVALIVTLVLTPTTLYCIPQTGISERISEAYNEIQAYQQKGAVSDSTNSRLEMWRAAWHIFLDNQIIGAGVGKFQQEAARLVATGEYHQVIDDWNHPHNEFLNALATRGLLGLVALIALFWVPGKIFYKTIRSEDAELAQLGLAGVILIASYLHFALTEAILNRSVPLLFFCFYLTLLTYYIATRSERMALAQRQDTA